MQVGLQLAERSLSQNRTLAPPFRTSRLCELPLKCFIFVFLCCAEKATFFFYFADFI